MRHPDRNLTTMSDLVAALRDFVQIDKIVWYRGQLKASWVLVPRIGRNPDHIKAELTIIKTFRQNARPYLHENPASDWEWVFLMQHHRAPTRLLDWTESPLVALYFALWDQKNEHELEDAALWFLDPIALNMHAGHRRAFERDILAFDIDDDLAQYLPDQVSARKADLNPVAAIGPRNSPRMVAQAGTFTIMHASPMAIEAVADTQHVWRMVIPAVAKSALRTELSLLGINEYSLFPDLDRVADIARGLIKTFSFRLFAMHQSGACIASRTGSR
jgi:hypothetical protein